MLDRLTDPALPPEERYRLGQALLAEHGIDALERHFRTLAAEGKFDEAFDAFVPFLNDWRYRTRAIAWYRDAVRDGRSPYLVSEVIARVWERYGTAAARWACDDAEDALAVTQFREHGDDFHIDMARRAVAGFRRVMAYEDEGGEHPRDVADGLHDAVRGAIWERGWQLMRIHARDRMVRIARLYPHIYGGDLAAMLDAVRWFLAPSKAWDEALAALDEAGEGTPELDLQALRWRAEACAALGNPARAAALESEIETALSGAAADAAISALTELYWSRYRRLPPLGGEELGALAGKTGELCARHEGEIPAALRLLRAHLAEDHGEYDAAMQDYLGASTAAPGGYLPDMFWRASAFLSSRGEWQAAARINENGARAHWANYRTPARLPPEQRYGDGPLLPGRAVMLNTGGIGDDLWRVFMLHRLKGGAADYACVVDARLVSLLARSFPSMRFLTRSETRGRDAVRLDEFHADRDGLHASIEQTMVTREIQEAIEDHGEVVISEDVFCAYFRAGGELPETAERQFLVPDPECLASARSWLAALPAGNLNIGLSWRTGVPHRNHFRIAELGPLLNLKGINWIVMQYTVRDEEIAEAKERFGVTLHVMPGVDLKDDIDQVMALGTALDFMVTTQSTIEPLVALTGTEVLAMASGYHSVAQYRIAGDGASSRIIPSLSHVSQREFGSREAVVRAAADRVAARVAKGRAS